MRHHFARAARQINQQVEFFRREMDFMPRNFDRPRIQSMEKSPAVMTLGCSSAAGVRRNCARIRASSSFMLNGLVT